MEERIWWVQQGDVAIKRTELIPQGKLEAVKSGVLVNSAVTQHTHRAVGANVVKVGSNLFIVAKKKFKVVHEEHKTIEIPAGTYLVDGIKEYDHFAEEARRVAD